jgi:hypothetical protein
VDGDDDPALARSTILSAAACGSSSASRSIPAAPSLELDVSLCAVRLRRATFLPSYLLSSLPPGVSACAGRGL